MRLDASIWQKVKQLAALTHYPFWTSVITGQKEPIDVASGSTADVQIIPGTNETWLIYLSLVIDNTGSSGKATSVSYCDGSATYLIDKCLIVDNTNGLIKAHQFNTLIITDTLYTKLHFSNNDSSAATGYYGYSGFKLGTKKANIQRGKAGLKQLNNKPSKRPLNGKLVPSPFDKLRDQCYIDPNDRLCCTMGKGNIAIDSDTNHIIESAEYNIDVNDVIPKLTGFRTNPVKTGWQKWLDKYSL